MKRLILICLLLAAAGCAVLRTQPTITLADIQFGEVRLLETDLVAQIRIQNESQEPLEIDGAAYRLYLNDLDLGRGVSDQTITVPRLGSTLQKVVFHVQNLTVISNIRSLVESGNAQYRIEARLYVRGPLREAFPVTASREGRLDVGLPAGE